MATSEAVSARHSAGAQLAPGPRGHLSRGKRLALIACLLVLALSTMYSTLVAFSRVYPALFPGQTLAGTIGVAGVVAPLPGLGSVENLNEDSPFNDRINILVIGLDKRPQDPVLSVYLTDLIAVASIDPITRTVNMLSFPRDLYVEIHWDDGPHDFYRDRINTSYSFGFVSGETLEAGAEQLQGDLLANFGITTDHWLILDFTGVEKLVEAVGGIDLDIPPELAVPTWRYNNDDRTSVWVSYPAGQTFLDGYNAVAFARYRNDSDLKRVQRQQLVFKAGIAKLFDLGLLDNAADLWDAYRSTVHTDISKARMLGLVPLIAQTQGRTSMYSLGDPVGGADTVDHWMTEEGKAVLLWDDDNVHYWLDKVFPKVKYIGSSVEIRDGLASDGGESAGALARYLLFYRNLPTVYLGPESNQREETVITLYGDRDELADDLGEWLGVPSNRIVREPRRDGSTLPDVVIVIGSDFQLPGR